MTDSDNVYWYNGISPLTPAEREQARVEVMYTREDNQPRQHAAEPSPLPAPIETPDAGRPLRDVIADIQEIAERGIGYAASEKPGICGAIAAAFWGIVEQCEQWRERNNG